MEAGAGPEAKADLAVRAGAGEGSLAVEMMADSSSVVIICTTVVVCSLNHSKKNLLHHKKRSTHILSLGFKHLVGASKSGPAGATGSFRFFEEVLVFAAGFEQGAIVMQNNEWVERRSELPIFRV